MRVRNLRSHLTVLVVAAVVPMIAFSVAVAALLERHHRASLDHGLRDTARALTIAVDRELVSSISTLAALATSDHIDRGDLQGFYAQSQRVLKTHRGWTTINLFQPSGQQIMNLARPFGAPLPFSGKLEEQREYLGDVLTSARHLLLLINDVLDLAKVEAGKMQFRRERVDVASVVDEVRSSLQSLAFQKGIDVEIRIDVALTSVVTDRAKFKQVLSNYLSNALKFAAERGQVVIRVDAEDGDEFRLEVEDTGVGIAPADIDRLFVEFQQLDSSAAKKHAGTGLGLALTKRIVEAQGGRVGVRSVPGQGSVFFAILPR